MESAPLASLEQNCTLLINNDDQHIGFPSRDAPLARRSQEDHRLRVGHVVIEVPRAVGGYVVLQQQ